MKNIYKYIFSLVEKSKVKEGIISRNYIISHVIDKLLANYMPIYSSQTF